MFFEDFNVGDEFRTYGRTVTEADVVIFASMTGAVNPLFLDEEYAKHTRFGTRLVPGILVLGITIGMIYQLPQGMFLEGFVALLEQHYRALSSVRIGDSLYVKVRVADKREVSGGRGIVTLSHDTYNQGDQKVMECESKIMVMKRDAKRQ